MSNIEGVSYMRPGDVSSLYIGYIMVSRLYNTTTRPYGGI